MPRFSPLPLATFLGILLSPLSLSVSAHTFHGEQQGTTAEASDKHQAKHKAQAKYLANAGVMVMDAGKKVLFDPFFHQDYGTYQLVPKDMHKAMMAGEPPYDNVDMLIISHAHGDHFSGADVVAYLRKHQQTRLVAPQQAIDIIKKQELEDYEQLKTRLHGFDLTLGDAAAVAELAGIKVEAVRIPHAGWPGRADIQNMVYRVTLNNSATVMHMGDADANDDHYLPYKDHWQARQTHTNFPPYWFFQYAEGRAILYEILNAKDHIGVHVPVFSTPAKLRRAGIPFFSEPGEVRDIEVSSPSVITDKTNQ